jgi:hypothetical protein
MRAEWLLFPAIVLAWTPNARAQKANEVDALRGSTAVAAAECSDHYLQKLPHGADRHELGILEDNPVIEAPGFTAAREPGGCEVTYRGAQFEQLWADAVHDYRDCRIEEGNPDRLVCGASSHQVRLTRDAAHATVVLWLPG